MKKKEPEPTLDQMTLRDLMAMFAMQGLVAHGGWKAEYCIPEAGIAGVTVAEEAYKYAAAMLKERKPKMKDEDQTPIRKDMDAPGMY